MKSIAIITARGGSKRIPKKNIKEGETLTVVVSLGKGIKIPDFSSMSVTQIDKWLKDNDFEFNILFNLIYCIYFFFSMFSNFL